MTWNKCHLERKHPLLLSLSLSPPFNCNHHISSDTDNLRAITLNSDSRLLFQETLMSFACFSPSNDCLKTEDNQTNNNWLQQKNHNWGTVIKQVKAKSIPPTINLLLIASKHAAQICNAKAAHFSISVFFDASDYTKKGAWSLVLYFVL